MISSSSRCAGRPDARKRADDVLHQLAALELRGERLTASLTSSGQLAGLGAGARSTHSPIGTIKPDLLGERDELGRRDHAALRMVPAQQRLEAGDPVAFEVIERLIVQLELVVA